MDVPKKIALATLISMSFPLAALADENGLYVGLEGGANWESAQSLRNGAAGVAKFRSDFVAGIVEGYAFSNGLRPEFEMSYRRNQLRKVNLSGLGSFDAEGFENNTSGMLNLWYDVKTPTGLFSVVHPYLGGGLGVSRIVAQNDRVNAYGFYLNDNHLAFAYQGGAGIDYELTKHLIFSLDWRYFQTSRASYSPAGGGPDILALYRANSLLGGFRFNFGIPPAPVAYAAPEPLPAAPPPPPAGPCRDSDGDGVCDAVDKCPGTPKGFKVDADGCIIEQKIILRGVNFEFNKDKLTAPAETTLDQVGAALVGQPSLRVEIAGYTDSVGSAAYNLALSKKRAAAVKNYLVSKGVPASNLVSQGYGKASPIATNDTEEGRAENRRVEFSVLNKPANADVVTKGSTEASKSAAEGDPVGKKVMKKKKHHRKVKAKATAQ